ncbi:hypothetical protein BDV38DRAFT_286032 [Aspergillus pseudotamarii]|uniref:Uncharacterized protein n=1 Tax=Aspergillus pseudotamarii TaxID=132259 RepID=A0A5N6SJV5_ASPPS|nr:uncharacterized protein BDV38DRAFT_286032 [Aspergillus pseudotamarii]KAE8134179.1 hypothetical protein BDV38DRAFT_286032 [Aspergillus pseudotamarii]
MAPASFSSLPRVGEYDVVCHHCNASVDRLHRSVSEQSGKTGNSSQIPSLPLTKPNKIYAGAFLSQSSQEALSPLASSYLMSLKQPLFHTPGYPACFTEPPYYANLQSPFVGMCLVNIKDCCQRIRARRAETRARRILRQPWNAENQAQNGDGSPPDSTTPLTPTNLPSASNVQNAVAGPSGQGQPQNNQGHGVDDDEIRPAPVGNNAGNASIAPFQGDEIQETGQNPVPSAPLSSKPQESDRPARQERQPVPIPLAPSSSKPQNPDRPARQQMQPVPIPGASSRSESQESNRSPKHKTDSLPCQKQALQQFEVDQSPIFPFSPSESSLDSRLRIGTQSSRKEDMDMYDISRRSWAASPQPTKSSQPQAASERLSKAVRPKKNPSI